MKHFGDGQRQTIAQVADASLGAQGGFAGPSKHKGHPKVALASAEKSAWAQGFTMVRPTVTQSCMPPLYHFSLLGG